MHCASTFPKLLPVVLDLLGRLLVILVVVLKRRIDVFKIDPGAGRHLKLLPIVHIRVPTDTDPLGTMLDGLQIAMQPVGSNASSGLFGVNCCCLRLSLMQDVLGALDFLGRPVGNE